MMRKEKARERQRREERERQVVYTKHYLQIE